MVSRKNAAHECVSEEALSHLRLYKYSSVDQSWISNNILRHYWNGAVELMPLWLAPNMITLLGFMFILANVAILQIMIPDLVGPAPSWVYYSFAFGLWAYSTMDNVDGKQARRTGTSSPLGELFDHGIDSLNCTLGSLLETAALGVGATRLGALTALIPVLPMYFSTWETYHTHTLFLGYFNGPTEGLILACSFMSMSGYFGPAIWQAPLSSYISLPSSLQSTIGSITFLDFLPWMLFISFFLAHLPGCVLNVVEARRKQNLPIASVFYEWIPIIVYCLATAAWVGSSHSVILPENHLVLWCLTQSFVFGRMTTKIILAHLTHQAFPYWTVLMTPLVGGAVLFNLLPSMGILKLGPAVERLFLWAYFVFAAVIYGRWAVLVTSSICDYLGIECLTIPKEKQRANEEARRAAGKMK